MYSSEFGAASDYEYWQGFDETEAEFGGPDSQEPSVFEELELSVNNFRLGGAERYTDLEGADRAAVPSVASQVEHLSTEISSWLSGVVCDTVMEGQPCGVRRTEITEFTACADVTADALQYWEKNYQRREDNPYGQFVEWRTRRKVLPLVSERVAGLRAAHKEYLAANVGTLFSAQPLDLSVIAKDKQVRTTAYYARFEAKLGLAALSVFTQNRRVQLQEFFDEVPYPDLMGVLADAEKVAKNFGLPIPDPAVTAQEDAIPF